MQCSIFICLHHVHTKLLSYVAIAVTISLVEIILPLDIGNLNVATHAHVYSQIRTYYIIVLAKIFKDL